MTRVQQFEARRVYLQINIFICRQADIDPPRCAAAANKESGDA